MDIVESIVTFWANVTAVWGIVPAIDVGLTWKTAAYLLSALAVVEMVEDKL